MIQIPSSKQSTTTPYVAVGKCSCRTSSQMSTTIGELLESHITLIKQASPNVPATPITSQQNYSESEPKESSNPSAVCRWSSASVNSTFEQPVLLSILSTPAQSPKWSPVHEILRFTYWWTDVFRLHSELPLFFFFFFYHLTYICI